MADISRTQLVVYAAVAVALLLIGVRAVRADQAGTDPPSRDDGAAAPAEVEFAPGGGEIVIDVAGAVRDPGVYRLPAGARVVDALVRAGGATGKAMLEGINRAARLSDGQQVVVPSGAPLASGAGVPAAAAGPIGLGTATVDQLEEIDGIGPVTAQSIVEFREEHGGLASVEQLDEISGIGPATMDALRARLQP